MDFNDIRTPTSATDSLYSTSFPSSPTAARRSAAPVFPWMRQFPESLVTALRLADQRDASHDIDCSEQEASFLVLEKMYLPDAREVESRSMFEKSKKQSRVIGGFKTRRGANMTAARYMVDWSRSHLDAENIIEKVLDVYVKDDGSLWIVAHPHWTPLKDRREVVVLKDTSYAQKRSSIDDRAGNFRVTRKRKLRNPSM